MIILGHLNLINVGGHYLTEAAVVVSLRYRYNMISLANRFNYHLQLVFMFEYLLITASRAIMATSSPLLKATPIGPVSSVNPMVGLKSNQ